MNRSVIAVALALAMSGTALPLITVPAAAHPRPPQSERISTLAGRIAFLKAELGITPAQEALWKPVAAAMRENDSQRAELQKKFHTAYANKKPDAVERLELREEAVNTHAQGLKRFLGAFKPLYASLSPEKKHVADVLFDRMGRRHPPGRP